MLLSKADKLLGSWWAATTRTERGGEILVAVEPTRHDALMAAGDCGPGLMVKPCFVVDRELLDPPLEDVIQTAVDTGGREHLTREEVLAALDRTPRQVWEAMQPPEGET